MYFLYTLYDVVATATFGPLMTCRSAAEATRYFADIIKNPQTLPGQHPFDFEMREVGSYSDQTGLIEGYSIPETVATGEQIVEAIKRSAAAQELTKQTSETL